MEREKPHRAWERRGTQDDCAVVMVHGIIGSPDHFLPFSSCFDETWSLYCLLLDGHGGTPRDFAHTRMSRWKQQVHDALERVCKRHKTVVLIGHSMGCLLLMEAAKSHTNIAAVLCLAPPFHVHLTWQGIRHALLVLWDKGRPDDAAVSSSKAEYSITRDKRLWIYVTYLPRYLELFRLSRQTRRNLDQVKYSCTMVFSGKDELVCTKRAYRAVARHTNLTADVLEHAMHHYYPPQEFARLCRRITALAEQVKGGIDETAD